MRFISVRVGSGHIEPFFWSHASPVPAIHVLVAEKRRRCQRPIDSRTECGPSRSRAPWFSMGRQAWLPPTKLKRTIGYTGRSCIAPSQLGAYRPKGQSWGSSAGGGSPNPLGHTVGDEIARMLKRNDARAIARRCFIADRQHCAPAIVMPADEPDGGHDGEILTL
jgi:hypothetical protein